MKKKTGSGSFAKIQARTFYSPRLTSSMVRADFPEGQFMDARLDPGEHKTLWLEVPVSFFLRGLSLLLTADANANADADEPELSGDVWLEHFETRTGQQFLLPSAALPVGACQPLMLEPGVSLPAGTIVQIRVCNRTRSLVTLHARLLL